ncbi:MAG: UDP-N-acetylmuramoyl-L-alanyl-D-glutamate--2,6-diaminopimelate ligase [Oceanococcus sp.]
MSFRLSQLLEVDAALCGENPVVRGIAMDSREVAEGYLFLACRGTESHGLLHLQQALQRGAVAIAWEPSNGYAAPDCGLPVLAVANLSRRVGLIAARFFAHPTRNLFVMGVTGTDGKTSCAHLFAQAAERLGRRCGMIGTVGVGFLDELRTATHTTPDPVALQAGLAALVQDGADSLAMEVSSHALDQGRINGVELDVAVFTNLSRDHLDYHGDLRNYARAKRRLLETPDLGALIINADDDFGRLWVDELAASRAVIAYGVAARPECKDWLFAENIQKSPQGLSFDLVSPQGRWPLRCGLIGHFNIYNLLAVAAAWRAAGLDLAEVVDALCGVTTVPGRIEAFRAPGKPLVVVDYAHTPAALTQVLSALKEHCQADGDIYCVFGCGGDRDRGKRPQMAAAAAELADVLILTDDNPRTESPQDIVADMVVGIPAAYEYTVIHDRGMAIDQAMQQAGPLDLVLVAGKGHEDYQQIGLERRPFSDREYVASRLHGDGGLACSA